MALNEIWREGRAFQGGKLLHLKFYQKENQNFLWWDYETGWGAGRWYLARQTANYSYNWFPEGDA